MFKKMKLKTYLLTVFTIIIILTAMITLLGTIGLLKTKENVSVFNEEILGAETAMKNCRIEMNIVARDLRELIIIGDKDGHNELIAQIDKRTIEINEQFDVFKEAYGIEDVLTKKFEVSLNQWFSITTNIKEELAAGNVEGAKEMISDECSPTLRNLDELIAEIILNIEQIKIDKERSIEQFILIVIVGSLVAFVMVLGTSLYFAFKTTSNITDTTNKIKDTVVELSKGNLQTSVEYEANNEFGELAEHINFSFKELSKYVEAIDYGMTEFSNGNFRCECPITFLGDFAHIQKSIENFQMKMNDTLLELDMAADQVSIGASQVAEGAIMLAQGATEQASSVEELSVTVADVAEQILQNAEYTQTANSLGIQAGAVVQKSQDEMKQMMIAINEIASVSKSIKGIVKAIDDIAFQTNILSLNAAVEAARAGSAGKGFSVVADEVRNLAQKSAEAAKSTTELIENTLRSVAHGEQLAISTNAGFEEVAEYADKILEMVAKISTASETQSIAISQIALGVDQISAVVQMNSATAEESAASSEELSGQAATMKSLIEQFQLKNAEINYSSQMMNSGENNIDTSTWDKY